MDNQTKPADSSAQGKKPRFRIYFYNRHIAVYEIKYIGPVFYGNFYLSFNCGALKIF